MANTESTFADRLQRGQHLHSIIASFDPAFAPPDEDLEPVEFLTFLEELDTLNEAVVDAEAEWKNAVAARLAIVTDIKDRALRALDRVKSKKDWDRQRPAVKSAADALRGYRPSRVKTPPKDDGTPAVMTEPKADQSFGDIKALLDKLIAALGKVPGYDTGAPLELTIAQLKALCTGLDTQNKAVADREQDLRAARDPRRAGYATLKERKIAIKDATRSQYGAKSEQFAQAKTVRV